MPIPVAEPGIIRASCARSRRVPRGYASGGSHTAAPATASLALPARDPDLAERLRVGDARLHEAEQATRLLDVVGEHEVEQRVVVEGAGERR